MSGLFLDGFADSCVSFLLLKVEPCAGTAVVYLDEIKAPIAEIQSGILLFVPIKAGTEAMVVGIILRTARVCTRIGVDSSHQAFRMYVVGHHFQPIRKTLRVRMHLARCISPAKEAVVDVDMGVATSFKPNLTIASACVRISESLMLTWKVFQELQPMMGGANCCASTRHGRTLRLKNKKPIKLRCLAVMMVRF